MAKATTMLAGGLLTLMVGSVNGTAEAQNPTLTVRVRNDARALDLHVAAAQEHVTQIYAKAGIDIAWVESDARLIVALISREQADLMHQDKDAMGYAPVSGAKGGRLAYVLNHRVDEVSAGYRSPKTIVLAAALAHEIGPAAAIKSAQRKRPDAQKMGPIGLLGCQKRQPALHARTGPGNPRRIGEWAIVRFIRGKASGPETGCRAR